MTRLLDAARTTVRALAMLLVAAVALLAYGAGRVGTLLRRGREARRRARDALRGRTLRRAMTALGPTFVKLGQVMSSRPDLFPPEIIDELRRLQDRLPPFPFRQVRRILAEDLGERARARLQKLEPEPVAAGSVAQVHRAALPGGRAVAVKVLRPGVRRQVERDAAILLWGARLAGRHPGLRLLDPEGHMRDFVGGIVAQTDLSLEADHYETFRRNFARRPEIIFPRVHRDLSSRRVLTMDFVEGARVDALPPGDHTRAAEAIRDAFLQMAFEDGFLHADLHPGNLRVAADDRVVIFDVGLVKRLPEDVLEMFVDFTRCMAMGDAEDIVGHLRRFHGYLDGQVDWAALRLDAEAFIGRFRRRKVAELEWREVMAEIFAVARRHRVRPRPELALVAVAIITAEGLGKMLNPDGDSMGELAGYLGPLLARRAAAGAPGGAAAQESSPQRSV